MKVCVTGAAGFIGSTLTLRLPERRDPVIGIDNHNDDYVPALKEARLVRQADHPNCTPIRMDMADRSDMALQKFVQAITQGETIQVFNHRRDFTYVDDVVDGVIRIMDRPAPPNQNWSSNAPDPGTSKAPRRAYNIGNNRSINLMDYIGALEKAMGKKAKKECLPMQLGDVPDTWANVDDFVAPFDYKSNASVEKGVTNFAAWFKNYYKV